MTTAEASAAMQRAAIRARYLTVDSESDAVASMRAFVRKPLKATPLQHRLVALRVSTVRALIHRAIASLSGSPCQFVSLGAGFDSLSLELLRAMSSSSSSPLRVFECDLPSVCEQKRSMIDSDRDLSAFVKQLDADRFQLVPCDLNVVDVYLHSCEEGQ